MIVCLKYMKSLDRRLKAHPYWIAIFIGFLLVMTFVAVYMIFFELSNKNTNYIKINKVENTNINISDVTTKAISLQVEPYLAPDYSFPSINDGLAPVVYRLATNQNVVFLGIDDGAFKDQSVIDLMSQNHIKASLFLSKAFIASNPAFFKQLVGLGSFVENHTLSHDVNMVKDQDYGQQKAEICGMSDYVEANYGRRPIFFRPPGGAYSSTMLKAAAGCGMKAVVTWIAKVNGGAMQYQVGNKLRAGDVVLMHFRPEFKQDLQAFIDACNAAGLHTALLEDASS